MHTHRGLPTYLTPVVNAGNRTIQNPERGLRNRTHRQQPSHQKLNKKKHAYNYGDSRNRTTTFSRYNQPIFNKRTLQKKREKLIKCR